MVSTTKVPLVAACNKNQREEPPMTPHALVSRAWVVELVVVKIWLCSDPAATETKEALAALEALARKGAEADGRPKRSSNLSCDCAPGTGPSSRNAGWLSLVRPRSLTMRTV